MFEDKPFVYQPDEDTMKIVNKALSMRISVDALMATIDEERTNTRGTMFGLFTNPSAFLLNNINPAMLGLNKAKPLDVFLKLISGKLVRNMHDSLTGAIEGVRTKIDGLALADLRMEHFDGVTDEWRNAIVLKILDIATKQAFDLVDLDPERDAYLLHGAKTVIYKKLGFPRL